MTDLEQSPRRIAPAYALAYAVALPILSEVARLHGYALAVHGSLATDMDLIAAPWVDEAAEPDALAEAVRDCLGGIFGGGAESASEAAHDLPHGRRSYSILPSNLFLGVPRLPFQPYIDLAVMPRAAKLIDEETP